MFYNKKDTDIPQDILDVAYIDPSFSIMKNYFLHSYGKWLFTPLGLITELGFASLVKLDLVL